MKVHALTRTAMPKIKKLGTVLLPFALLYAPAAVGGFLVKGISRRPLRLLVAWGAERIVHRALSHVASKNKSTASVSQQEVVIDETPFIARKEKVINPLQERVKTTR